MLFAKKKMDEKIIYYTDERNDEFSTAQITPKKIDENYCYLRKGAIARFLHIFWYRIIAIPLAFLYMKLHFRHKIVNKKVLKLAKKTGYFLYGNHTHFLADALIPTMVSHPKAAYVIVHPNNVSMPYLGRITPYLGALPLPDGMTAAKNFMRAIDTRAKENKCVMIYPEAHIWPFYTDIRDFMDTSFQYPIRCDKPVYCFTNTYQKRRIRKTPRIVTYVDGPFYPKEGLSPKEKRKQLRDEVYQTMKKRAENNNIVLITYKKKEEQGA